MLLKCLTCQSLSREGRKCKQLPDCSSVAGLQICVQHWGDDQHILVNFLILGDDPKKNPCFSTPPGICSPAQLINILTIIIYITTANQIEA